MKLFKHITLFALPLMLLLMLIRLTQGLDPYVSITYVKDVIATWDPMDTLRKFANLLNDNWGELRSLIANGDANFFDVVINCVAFIAKMSLHTLTLLVVGPLKELLDFFVLLFKLIDGISFQPGIQTPIDKGFIV